MTERAKEYLELEKELDEIEKKRDNLEHDYLIGKMSGDPEDELTELEWEIDDLNHDWYRTNRDLDSMAREMTPQDWDAVEDQHVIDQQLRRVRKSLEKLYGTNRPKCIADYWQRVGQA